MVTICVFCDKKEIFLLHEINDDDTNLQVGMS